MRAQGPLDSVGTILSSLAKRLGLESHLFELRLQHRWSDIVGEPMASHTRPDHIRFKKLSLIVRNSVWLQQLTFLKPALLAKLNDQGGASFISDISFRVGEIPPPPIVPEREKTPLPLVNESLLLEASAHAMHIQDPELRQCLSRVIAEALSQPSP